MNNPNEMQLGVGVDPVQPIVHMRLPNPDGSFTHVTMTRYQAFQAAQHLTDAIATIDARLAECADLAALYALPTESPET